MIAIFVYMKALPAKRKELVQTLETLVAETQSKTGCLSAYFYQGGADENTFLWLEQWSNPKDAEDHLASDTFTVLQGTSSLMAEKPEIVIHTVVHSEVLKR